MSPNASVTSDSAMVDEDILFESGPNRQSEAKSSSSPMRENIELQSGPSARRDVRVPLAARDPAQVRRRPDPSSSSGIGAAPKRPRVPDPTSPTVSYRSDADSEDMLLHFAKIEVRPD